jgi:hypothetical protein
MQTLSRNQHIYWNWLLLINEMLSSRRRQKHAHAGTHMQEQTVQEFAAHKEQCQVFTLHWHLVAVHLSIE